MRANSDESQFNREDSLEENDENMSVRTYSDGGSPQKLPSCISREGKPIYLKTSDIKIADDQKEFWNNREWDYFRTKGFLMLSLVTHECRSSKTKEQLAPFSRIDDGKMHILGVQR